MTVRLTWSRWPAAARRPWPVGAPLADPGWYPDCWDLPGGHVADGETPEAGLRRELLEELDITIVIGGMPFAKIQGVDLRMDAG
jgi:8-oxo-dGTP pyrophosphatase MutT (NUDIX family)